jgi:hypothetical protein
MLVLGSLQAGEGKPYYLCVAISTTFPDPPAANNIPLPWHPLGNAATGLRKRSAVVLDWVRRMQPESIIQKDGYVTNELLKHVLTSLDAFRNQSKP